MATDEPAVPPRGGSRAEPLNELALKKGCRTGCDPCEFDRYSRKRWRVIGKRSVYGSCSISRPRIESFRTIRNQDVKGLF